MASTAPSAYLTEYNFICVLNFDPPRPPNPRDEVYVVWLEGSKVKKKVLKRGERGCRDD